MLAGLARMGPRVSVRIFQRAEIREREHELRRKPVWIP